MQFAQLLIARLAWRHGRTTMALDFGGGLASLMSTFESLKTGITSCFEIRDKLKQGPELIKLNNLVLEAQKSLLAHMAQLTELQGK